MVPFLLGLATPASEGAKVQLVYLPERRLNRVVAGSTTSDGTLITKSHEAADQSEVTDDLYAAASAEGTLLTCTREAADQSEITDDLHAVASFDGTLMTRTGEASDQSEATDDLGASSGERRLDELTALLGTKKTGSGEQADPADVVVDDYVEEIRLPVRVSPAPWPVSQLASA